jgi:hypothetical protein
MDDYEEMRDRLSQEVAGTTHRLMCLTEEAGLDDQDLRDAIVAHGLVLSTGRVIREMKALEGDDFNEMAMAFACMMLIESMADAFDEAKEEEE